MVAQEPELAAEIISHTQRKTDRVKASHHELISGSTRRAAGRNPAARSRIDAHRYRGVRPDELRAGGSIASRDHIKSKEKNKHFVVPRGTW
jgi:hypothetical protein